MLLRLGPLLKNDAVTVTDTAVMKHMPDNAASAAATNTIDASVADPAAAAKVMPDKNAATTSNAITVAVADSAVTKAATDDDTDTSIAAYNIAITTAPSATVDDYTVFLEKYNLARMKVLTSFETKMGSMFQHQNQLQLKP